MKTYLLHIGVMAIVTYIVRMLPMIIFQKKIKNRFIRSFLYYIPYAVLAAMTFPAVFSSTGSIWSAAAGVVIAVILAFFEKGLVTVALFSCLSALFVSIIEKLL
jgi:branched-subunit amino acid transport protein